MAKRFNIDKFMDVWTETSCYDYETYPWWMARRMTEYIINEYGLDKGGNIEDDMIVDMAVSTIVDILDMQDYDVRQAIEEG